MDKSRGEPKQTVEEKESPGNSEVHRGVDSDMDLSLIPRWCKCCLVSPVPFSCYCGIFFLVTSALGAYLTSQITTIEKQYGLSSSESGLLLSMNDVGFLIAVLLMSYFGRHSHIPRILASCGLIYGISSFLCILPHFFTQNDVGFTRGDINSTRNTTGYFRGDLCSLDNRISEDEDCSESGDRFSSTKSLAMTLISIGMFLQGVAKSPRQPLSQTYIDDNVPKAKSGLYIGTMTLPSIGISLALGHYSVLSNTMKAWCPQERAMIGIIISMAVFGPAMAFGIGGSISTIYVTLEDTDMSPRDPRWVGAWWLGYLIFGSISFVLALPLFLFPKRLIREPSDIQKMKKTTHDEPTQVSLSNLSGTIKGLLKAFGRLASRPVYVCLILGTSVKVFSIAAVVAFTPKYMQIHYGLSVLKANIFVGFVSVGAAATALFLSGILARVLRLELRGMVTTSIITQVVSTLIFFIGIFFVCPQPSIHDFDIYSIQSNVPMTLSADAVPSCYADCDCSGAKYFPICGSNEVTYFSPCHAGCTDRAEKGFINCRCISNTTTRTRNGNLEQFGSDTMLDAMPGQCQQECGLYAAFVAIQFVSSFISALAGVPGTLALLRSVDEKDKSLGLGVNSFMSSLLGWFLGPIVMGAVIDTTCRLWNTSCSEESSCAVYDVADLRYKIHGVDAGISLIYIILFVMAYVSLVCCNKGKLSITKNEMEIREDLYSGNPNNSPPMKEGHI